MKNVFTGITSYEKICATPNNLYLLFQASETLKIARYYTGTGTWSREETFNLKLKVQQSCMHWDNESILLLTNENLVNYNLVKKVVVATHKFAKVRAFAGEMERNEGEGSSANVSTCDQAAQGDRPSSGILAASASTSALPSTMASTPLPEVRITWTCMAQDPATERIYGQCFIAVNEGNVRLALYYNHLPSLRWTEVEDLKPEDGVGNVRHLKSEMMAIWKGKMYLLLEKEVPRDFNQMPLQSTLYSSLQMVSVASVGVGCGGDDDELMLLG